MLNRLNHFLNEWESFWLAGAFLVSICFEAFTAYVVWIEFKYDERKDLEKKQRRTKTTRKTTTQPSGASVVEESVETTEPVNQGESK